jgi:isopentenyl diphosphate isomerase/L-lactate dehydrogenase-like FMN-dependent dehydrogenase
MFTFCNHAQLARAAQELKIPYIASGGIADGRGLAAALALGAAVCMVALPSGLSLINLMHRG